jgi:hypothetical protein
MWLHMWLCETLAIGLRLNIRGPLVCLLKVPEWNWEVIRMDFIVGLP